jgi:hypothetical protein
MLVSRFRLLNSCLLAAGLTFISGISSAWDNNQIDNIWHSEDLGALNKASNGENFEQSYASYRLAMAAINQGDKKLAKSALDKLRKRLKNKYKTADEAALYSASLGLSITLKPWQAAFIAKGAENALDYSFENFQDHAPTLMVKGIALYNTPKLLGGDRELALETFNKAIELYDLEEAWGYEDARLWRVKALYALELSTEATSSLEQLRADYPNFKEAQVYTFE